MKSRTDALPKLCSLLLLYNAYSRKRYNWSWKILVILQQWQPLLQVGYLNFLTHVFLLTIHIRKCNISGFVSNHTTQESSGHTG